MVEALLAVILISSIFMSGVRRIKLLTQEFMLQSGAIALVTIFLGYKTGEPHYYFLGILTIIIKIFIIPFVMNKAIVYLKKDRETDLIMNGFWSYIFTGLSIMIAFGFLDKSQDNFMKVGIVLFIVGGLLTIARRKAITQMIGFLTMENGIVLFEISLTKMPILIEAGILFEGLILAIIMGIMIFNINKAFNTLNTDLLSNLKG